MLNDRGRLIGDFTLCRVSDERFFVGLDKTRSKKFLLLVMQSTVTTEVRFLDAARPGDDWAVLQALFFAPCQLTRGHALVDAFGLARLAVVDALGLAFGRRDGLGCGDGAQRQDCCGEGFEPE